ncbi:uncharacterized protein [Apostichopus japonicus]|uniref:uncharacterized protein isoform X2 n=1 Tax=Stichopus japonicus TaxID=307972 RepID=UPI003AB787EB
MCTNYNVTLVTSKPIDSLSSGTSSTSHYLSLSVSGPLLRCPDGYEVGFDNRCYSFHQSPVSFAAARSSCLAANDSDLVIIDSPGELEFLLNKTQELNFTDNDSLWIGYFDRATEGHWTWADCQDAESWQEALWGPDQPTGYDEDCGALESSGLLSDYVCDQGFRYVCEISPKGFSRDDANAEEVTAKTRTQYSVTVNWKVSEVNCDVFGYTIRLRNIETEIVKAFYAHGGATNSLVADGLENNSTYQVTVAGLQIDRQLPEVGFVNVSTGCPDGYETSPIGGCYFFFSEGRTYDVARRSCLSDPEGDLAIIDTEAELNYLVGRTAELMNSQSWWIGFFDISVEGSWMWADCTPESEWQNSLWADGEPGNGVEDCGALSPNTSQLYDNVCDVFLPYVCELTTKGFSRDDANVHNVAALPISYTETNVTWENSEFNCDVFGYNIYYTSRNTGIRSIATVYGGDATEVTLQELEEGVIYDISVAALQTERELPEVGPVAVCPYLYEASPSGSCYYFSNGRTSYQGARGSCLSDPNGDLAIINNQDELDYLVERVVGGPRWIGYFDRATEGHWTWADCQDAESWQEALWGPDQPTGYDEDCGALESSGLLSDYVCDQGFRYVCEISPKGFSRDDANAEEVTAKTRTQYSVTVNWKVSEVNCDVFGYTIRLRNIETEIVKAFYAHGGATNSLVADSLERDSTYQVTVAGLQIDRQLPEVGFVNVSTGCPDGYETSPTGGCYFFFSEGRTYDVARRSCLSDPEGDLAIIDTQEELDYLVGRTAELMNSQNWWIGFFDISVEGSWMWADCTPESEWQNSLWADGEPGNGVEDCGALSPNTSQLYDNVCDVFLPYVCELTTKGFSRDDANVHNVAALPISYTETNVTWENSEFNCDVFGYNIYYTSRNTGIRSMATVYGGDATEVTLQELEEGVIYDISVAALQTERELPEVGPVAVCPYLYEASPSGSCYYFSNGRTSYQGARGSCLSDPNGDLAIINNQEELDYLVERVVGGPRWIGYFDRATEGHWTWADCQDAESWQEALWGPDQPTGYDEDCGALESSGLLSDYVCDQGFRYVCEISPKGFSRDDANAEEVTAKTRTQYSVTVNWKVSEVNCDVFGYTIRLRNIETEIVKAFYAHGGATNSLVADSLERDSTYQVTVAGLQIDRQLPEVGFVNVSTGCPDGYETSPTGGCYFFFSEGRTYDVARRSCLSDPEGDLAIIDTQEELDYLVGRTAELMNSQNWWIGFFDISVEGSWMWADCTPESEWQNSLWADGEPGNGVEDCGALSPNTSQLYDNVCDVFLPYVCELTTKGFSRDDANVHNVAALPISYTETNVTWENSEFNCDVFGYNIYYTSRNTGIRSMATVYGGDATEVTLQELEEGVIYDISVAALQTERELPEVGPVAVCPYLYEASPSGSCYYFSNGRTSYQGARGSCLSDPNGDLAIINNQEELDYLVERVVGGPRWIGYFDRATEGHWTWADCQDAESWQEALWGPDQPTGYDEDCGALESSGLLSDYVCDQGFRYVCEISPKGFSRDDANAEEVTANTRTQYSVTVNWKVSEVNCDVFGYTIRLRNIETEIVKAFYAHGGATNSLVADGLENNSTYQVTVAGLQIDRQLPEVGFVNVSTGCPDGYETSPIGGCYFFFSEGRTYDVARRSCLSDPEGDLAIIDTEKELDYLVGRTAELMNSQNWWIGFFDISVEGSWMWADCTPESEWQNSLWADGEPGNGVEDCGALSPNTSQLYDNVCDVFLPYVCELTTKGFSRDDANVHNVAALPISYTETNVTWENSEFNCDVFGYNIYYTSRNTGIKTTATVYGGDATEVTLQELEEGVIYDISVAALQTERELPEVGPVAVCPYLYEASPSGSCYYFSNGRTSYQGARGSCLSDPNGDLAIINNQEELDYLVERVVGGPRWIGYFDRATEGHWTWADCQDAESWQVALWGPDQPTGYDEDCGALESSGLLSDYVCDQGFRYVCEISPKGFSRDDANAEEVTANTRTQYSVTVNWKVSEVNCDVFGYTIRLLNIETEIVKAFYAHGGATNSLVADGLENNSTYQVTVAGLQIDRQLPEVGFVNVSTGCPDGYETSPIGGCYFFFSEGRTYDVARRSCLSDPEGDLAIIDTEKELDYLVGRTAELMNSQNWWIGFFDISVEGSWTWADCTPESEWQNSLWADGEPGNGVEDCGALSPNTSQLYDNVCDVFLPYVCELTTKGFSRDDANVHNVAALPISYTETNVTWENSEFNCDVFGYNIYYTSRNTGIRTTATVYGGDATEVTLQELEEGVIYDISVAALQTERELPEVGPVAVCPYLYEASPSGSCYYFSNGRTSYQGARGSCLSDPNGDLAIINNQDELDYLVERVVGGPRWIGYFDRATEGHWTWADCQDAESWQEALWGPDQPTGYDEDCGALESSGLLSDYVCDQGFRYICEISPKGFSRDDANAEEVTANTRTQYSVTVNWKVSEVNCDVFGYTIRLRNIETEIVKAFYAHGGATNSLVADGLENNSTYQVTVAGLQIDRQLPEVGFVNVSTGCPDGYETSPTGGCYFFFSEGRTYDVARRSCLSDPEGDLAIIDTEEELNYLVGRTAELMNSQNWWIGFFDISVEGSWTWADCTPESEWQNSLWADGEPGNGVEDCGALSPNTSQLYDNVCDVFLPYVCELTTKSFSRDDANVQNVAALPISYTETNVTWENSEFNCDVFGYNIYYTSRNTGIRSMATVYGGDATEVTLQELEEGVIYDISVAALQTERELPEVGPVAVCPYLYEASPSGSCYYFSNGRTSYQGARGSCLSDPNGDLAIINNQEELDYLVERIVGGPRWIGYFDRATEGHWTWADCQDAESWQEALWGPDQPTGYDEDCGALESSGLLSDYVCDQGFRYVCEISPKGFSRDDANAEEVTAKTRTQYSVTVNWKVSEVNCDVFGYTIRLRNIETEIVKAFYAHGGATNSLVADGLENNSTYQVTVAGLQIDRQLPEVGFVNVSTGCPDGYETSPTGGCYFFFSEGRTYDVARRSCLSDPEGDLAIIDTEEELNYLVGRTAELMNSQSWWIGFFDISVEGSWTWADCTPESEWQNSLWADGEPGNGVEDCGALSPNTSQLYDNVCDVFLPYVCELTTKSFSRDDANVHNVAALPISYTETNVTWENSEFNCDVFGYNIYYTSRNTGIRSMATVYGGDATEVTLQELEEGVIYDISVAALQTERELPEVGPVAVCPYLYEASPSGSCYYFSNGRTSYQGARGSCLSDPNGDLAIINNQEGLDYLVERIVGGPRWIGYFDRATEGHWTWADCQDAESWQEALWGPDQPTGYDEDCGALESSGLLSDYVCDQSFLYVCEISPKGFSRDEANAADVLVESTSATQFTVTWVTSEFNCDVYGYTIRLRHIPSGEMHFYFASGGDTNYYVADGLRAGFTYQVTVAGLQIDRELPEVGFINVTTVCPSFFEAAPFGGCYNFSPEEDTFDIQRQSCQSASGADLVVVDNQQELDYLMSRTTELSITKFWLGLFDFGVEGDWRWVTCEAPTSWQEYLWAPKEPGNGLEDCGVMASSTGQMSSAVCDEYFRAICEVTPKSFTLNDTNVISVSAHTTSYSTILVQWELSPVGCEVVGYRIFYSVGSSPSSEESRDVNGGDVTSYELTDLLPSTLYITYVAALYRNDELDKVGPAVATTFTVCDPVTIINQNGTITSPQYPNPYPNNAFCEWYLSAPEENYLLLQLQEFETKRSYDYLTIGEGSTIDFTQALYRFSGILGVDEDIPAKILSPSESIWVVFESSAMSNTLTGFSIDVSIVKQGPSTPVQDSQYIVGQSGGTISSPNFDQGLFYPNNIDLIWFITVSKGYQVDFLVTLVMIEENVDYLKVGEGVEIELNTLLTLTGNTEEDTKTNTETNQAWIRFTADESISNRGFSLEWAEDRTVGEPCPAQELTEASGLIQSPDYPNSYPHNQDCVWTITLPSEGNAVLLVFEEFALEFGFDYLYVGEGPDLDENVVSILTGFENPSEIQTSTNQVWLRFTSDEAEAAAGFSIQYSSTPLSTPVPTEPPRTPSLENRQDSSVIIVVLDQNQSWFPDNELTLAIAVAQALTEYCAENPGSCLEESVKRRRKLLASEYQETDVDFVLVQESGDNLEVYTWVWEPTSPGTGIEQDVLKTALDDKQETIKEIMDDPTFDFTTELPEDPITSQGLEAWSIALIIAATVVLLIAIVGYFEFKSRRKESNYLVAGDKEDEEGQRHDSDNTPREAEEGAVSQNGSPDAQATLGQTPTETNNEYEDLQDIPLQEKKDKEENDRGMLNKAYEDEVDEFTKV